MPFLDVYISNWEDAVVAAKGDDEIGTPKRRSPFIGTGSSTWRLYHQWRKQGRIDCTQTDWAGWVAKLRGADIKDFVKIILDETDSLAFPHIEEQIAELKAFVYALDSDKHYALVATET